METAADVITQVRFTYPDLTPAEALTLFGWVDEQILMTIPMRRAKVRIPLVAGQLEYPLDRLYMRTWSATLRQSPIGNVATLKQTNVDLLDEYTPHWRYLDPSTPNSVYTAENETEQITGFVPASDKSTLAVTGATNASPIVITTNADHGLSTGDYVFIYGVEGNTAANNADTIGAYWSITKVSDTEFSLDGSTGNDDYTTGGYVLATGSPIVELETTKRVIYEADTDLPAIPMVFDVYVSGVKYRYAVRRDAKVAGGLKGLFESDLAQMNQMYQDRNREKPRVQTIKQRPGGQYGGSVMNYCGGTSRDDY